MFKRADYWRDQARALQTQLDAKDAALDAAREQLAGIELRLADRAALISITREGRKNHFTFVRNGEVFRVTTMGTWDDDVEQWKRELLNGNSN